jgi:hypothetical protein
VPRGQRARLVQIGHGGFPRGLGAWARMNRDGFGELCAEANLGNDPHQGSDEPDPDGSWTAPKYPKVAVKLVGKDANAFGIVRKVAAAMDEAGVPQSEVDTFMQAAMAHDYDHLCGQS